MNKKKKPYHNTDHRRSTSANQARNDIDRNQWDDGYNVQSTIEGAISPVNYAGTQINIWGTPGGNMTDGLMHLADSGKNYGYMTEQMLEVSLFCCNLVHCARMMCYISTASIEEFTDCTTENN